MSRYLESLNSEVKEYFKSQGVNLVEENPEVCVLAYDTEITFEKIRKFNEFLVKGAFYVVTHPDTVCPSESVSWPDLGSFIKLFECSANRIPDIICGKPFSVPEVRGQSHSPHRDFAVPLH